MHTCLLMRVQLDEETSAVPDATGTPCYDGLAEALELPHVHAHLYGKSTVKPHRKMGHITVTGPDVHSVQQSVLKLRETVKVRGSNPA